MAPVYTDEEVGLTPKGPAIFTDSQVGLAEPDVESPVQPSPPPIFNLGVPTDQYMADAEEKANVPISQTLREVKETAFTGATFPKLPRVDEVPETKFEQIFKRIPVIGFGAQKKLVDAAFGKGTTAQLLRSAVNNLIGMGEFFTSPGGAATLAIGFGPKIAGLPPSKAAGTAMAGAFAVDMGLGTTQGAIDTYKNWPMMNHAQRVEALSGLITSGLLTLGPSIHVLSAARDRLGLGPNEMDRLGFSRDTQKAMDDAIAGVAQGPTGAPQPPIIPTLSPSSLRREALRGFYEHEQPPPEPPPAVPPAVFRPPPPAPVVPPTVTPVEEKGAPNAAVNAGIESIRREQEYIGTPQGQAVPPNAPEIRQGPSEPSGSGNRIVGGGLEQEAQAAGKSPGLMPESAKPIDWRQELNDTIEQLRTQIPQREELTAAMAQVREPLVAREYGRLIDLWDDFAKETDPATKIKKYWDAYNADKISLKYLSKAQKDELFDRMLNGGEAAQKLWVKSNLDAVPEGVRAVRMRNTRNPEWTYIIVPSTYPEYQGKWQATRFDQYGPSGHFNADTIQDAVSTLSGTWVKSMGTPWGGMGEWKVERVERKPPGGGERNAKEERLQGPQEVANVPPAGPAAPEPITVRTATGREASVPRSIDEQKGSEMTAGEGPKGMPLSAAELAKLLEKAKKVETKAKAQYQLKKDQGNKTVNAELRFKWRQAKLRVQELRNNLKAQKRIEEGPKQVTVKAERTADVGGERPPDIIDDFRGIVGGKLSLSSAQEYMEDIGDRLKAGGVLRKLFTRQGGMAIDDALDALHREGLWTRIETETQFLEAIMDAAQVRRGIKTEKTKEQKAEERLRQEDADFAQEAFTERKDANLVKVDMLLEGDTFELRGNKFVVEELIVDEESGELAYVRLKDGRRFGMKTVGGGDEIYVDEASLKDASGQPKKEPKVEDVWNVEEEPAKAKLPEKLSTEEIGKRIAYMLSAESMKPPEWGNYSGVNVYTDQSGNIVGIGNPQDIFPNGVPEGLLNSTLWFDQAKERFEWDKSVWGSKEQIDEIKKQIDAAYKPPQPASPAAEQPAVEGVPAGGPAKAPEPARPSGNVDLFGNPIEEAKPTPPIVPEAPAAQQTGLDLGAAPPKPVEQRPITPAERKELLGLEKAIEKYRAGTGPKPSVAETQRYEELVKLAGQEGFGFATLTGRDALVGELKTLTAQLAEMEANPPRGRGKRYEQWSMDKWDIERKIRNVRSKLTEGQGETIFKTEPVERASGYWGIREFRVRQLTDAELRERYSDPEQRFKVMREFGDKPFVAESRLVEYEDQAATKLQDAGVWYVDGWGKTKDESIVDAKDRARRDWDKVPKEVPKPVEAPKPSEPPKEEGKRSQEEWEKLGVKYARRSDGTLKTKEEYTPEEWKAYTDSVIDAKLREQPPLSPEDAFVRERLARLSERNNQEYQESFASTGDFRGYEAWNKRKAREFKEAETEFRKEFRAQTPVIEKPSGAPIGTKVYRSGYTWEKRADGWYEVTRQPANKILPEREGWLEKQLTNPDKNARVVLPKEAKIEAPPKNLVAVANEGDVVNGFKAVLFTPKAGGPTELRWYRILKDNTLSKFSATEDQTAALNKAVKEPPKPPPPVDTRTATEILGKAKFVTVDPDWIESTGATFIRGYDARGRFSQVPVGDFNKTSFANPLRNSDLVRFEAGKIGTKGWEPIKGDIIVRERKPKEMALADISEIEPGVYRVPRDTILQHGAISEAYEAIVASGELRAGKEARTGTIDERGLIWFSPEQRIADFYRRGLGEVSGGPFKTGGIVEFATDKPLKLIDRKKLITDAEAKIIAEYNGRRQNYDPVEAGQRFDRAIGKVLQNSALSDRFMPELLKRLGYDGMSYQNGNQIGISAETISLKGYVRKGERFVRQETGFRQASLPRTSEATAEPDRLLAEAKGPQDFINLLQRPEVQLPDADRALLQEFFRRPTIQKLDGLRLAIVEAIKSAFVGDYDPKSRLARFINADSGIHETLHDLWYFLKPEDRMEYIQLRQKAISDAMKDLPRNYAEIAALEKLAKEPLSSEEFINQKLPRGLYFLANEREFFVAAMQHRFLRDVMRPEAKGLVAKTKAMIQDLWDWLKSKVGIGDKRDALYRKILKGEYELSPEEGARLEAKEIQGALPRTPEEMRKQKVFDIFGQRNVAGRVLGAYSEPAKLKMEIADRLNLSDAARRMIRLPRDAEMYALAAAELRGIENYIQARDATPADKPFLRWNVIHDAMHSITYQEELARKLTNQYQRQVAKVESPSFQKRISREAQLALKADLAKEKEETFRNVIAQKAAALEAQMKRYGADAARIETLREDLRLTLGLNEWTMAVSQQMDNIVNAVYPEFTAFGRGGYWTRWRENLTGPKSGEEFLRLYLAARRAQGNPLENAQELTLARLAADILGVNFELTNKLMWAQRWAAEPDFARAVNELGAAFVKRLNEDPAAAIRDMIAREGRLAGRAAEVQAAYSAINKEVMRELEKLGDLEQAATAMKELRNSDQWRNLVNTVYADAEGLHVPDIVRTAIRDGTYSSIWNEATGRTIRIDPTGKTHDINLGWTKAEAVEAQKKIGEYLTAVDDWLNNPEVPANHPDRPYWQQEADFTRAIYKTASVFDPQAAKSLWVHSSLTMPEFFFRQAKIPDAKLAQDMAENFERANSIGKQWSVEFDQKNMSKVVAAMKSHGMDPKFEMPEYRENVFASLAWHYRNGKALKPGDKLYGMTITKEDIDLLRHQGLGIYNLIRRDMDIGRLGRESKMQHARLVDKYFSSAFLIRRPQEFGAEHGTTVPRDFSTRGGGFADVLAETKGDLDKVINILNLPQYFEPVFWRWIAERSSDYNADTGFEPILTKLRDRIHAGEGPRTVEEALDFIQRNTDATPETVKKSIIGNLYKEVESYYRRFIEKEEARAQTVRVLRATSEGPFNTAFEKDIGNSFFYDYGMFSTHEVRSAALDSASFYLERVEVALRNLELAYSNALKRFEATAPNSPEREALKRENKELFKTGDDFRDYAALQLQRNETRYFIDNLPIWSGQNVARLEGLNTLFRIIGDSVVSKLGGWKTMARVFTGSAVKQGFVFSSMERSLVLSYVKAAMSMATSAYHIGLKGPLVVMARHLGLAPKEAKEFSGIMEEIFRQGKYFDKLYNIGMGTKTPLWDTIKNNLTMPYSHGRGFDPRFSGNAGIRLLQKGVYRALSGFETPLEVLRTIFPTLGYSVAYDSVARQTFNVIRNIERQARVAFELHEKAGTLNRFDLNDPISPKNSYQLSAKDILPSGLFPRTETELTHAREMFKRGTERDLKDFVLEFWAKLAKTPKDQRGNVHLLSADAKTPEEAAKLNEARSLAVAAIGLMDIHHSGFTNRMWVMRHSFMWRTMQPIAGWTFQSTRQLPALFGKSANDPVLRPKVHTALTAMIVLAGLAAMAVGGDAEKRIFDELEWIINKRVDPVRYFGMGRDAKENAIIAMTDVFTYITVLSGQLEKLFSEKGSRASITDQLFAVSLINSMIRYVSGVMHTGDPTYGLSSFVTREAPALKPLIRRLDPNEGLSNMQNAITAIQRFAPKELIRQTTGGYGMPTPTELSPIKSKLQNAIYSGRSDEVVEQYGALQQKAIELGRTEPLRLAADIVRSMNPYTLALTGHPTTAQRSELIGRLSERERQVVLDAESMYLAAAQLVGVQSQMTREERGGGTLGGAVGFVPSSGGQAGFTAGVGPAMAVGARSGGGAPFPRIAAGGGGGGAIPRRISLGIGAPRMGYRRLGGISAGSARIRGSKLRTAKKRFTYGRLKARSGKLRRTGLRTRLAALPRRRVSLRI